MSCAPCGVVVVELQDCVVEALHVGLTGGVREPDATFGGNPERHCETDMDDDFASLDDEFAAEVRTFGWSMASIDHKPLFQYTIGLMETCRHPEFIVFGLEPEHGHALFSGLMREIRAGRSFADPGVHGIRFGDEVRRVGFRRVHPTQHAPHLGFAMGFLTGIGRIGELEAVQVFWPDVEGRFPFDVGCDLAVFELQPRLDVGLTPREVRTFRRRFGSF